jgi:hypothetical protein
MGCSLRTVGRCLKDCIRPDAACQPLCDEPRTLPSPLLSESQLGMLPQRGVVSPPGRAGGEALERSLMLYVIDAGVAVTWCIPEEMSLRGISAI